MVNRMGKEGVKEEKNLDHFFKLSPAHSDAGVLCIVQILLDVVEGA